MNLPKNTQESKYEYTSGQIDEFRVSHSLVDDDETVVTAANSRVSTDESKGNNYDMMERLFCAQQRYDQGGTYDLKSLKRRNPGLDKSNKLIRTLKELNNDPIDITDSEDAKVAQNLKTNEVDDSELDGTHVSSLPVPERVRNWERVSRHKNKTTTPFTTATRGSNTGSDDSRHKTCVRSLVPPPRIQSPFPNRTRSSIVTPDRKGYCSSPVSSTLLQVIKSRNPKGSEDDGIPTYERIKDKYSEAFSSTNRIATSTFLRPTNNNTPTIPLLTFPASSPSSSSNRRQLHQSSQKEISYPSPRPSRTLRDMFSSAFARSNYEDTMSPDESEEALQTLTKYATKIKDERLLHILSKYKNTNENVDKHALIKASPKLEDDYLSIDSPKAVKWKNEDELVNQYTFDDDVSMYTYNTEYTLSHEEKPKISNVCNIDPLFALYDCDDGETTISHDEFPYSSAHDDDSCHSYDFKGDTYEPDFVVVQSNMSGKWSKFY